MLQTCKEPGGIFPGEMDLLFRGGRGGLDTQDIIPAEFLKLCTVAAAHTEITFHTLRIGQLGAGDF